MTRKSTKRSLALSILSMALCLAMLIGSTYAWFSDEAKTKGVTITAGNLDVEIVKGDTAYDSISEENTYSEEKSLFPTEVDNILWEPGVMATSDSFKIANKGTLALTYKLNVTPTMTEGADTANLLDVIQYKVVSADSAALAGLKAKEEKSATYADRLAAWEAFDSEDSVATTGIVKKQSVSEKALVIVLFWKADESTALKNPDNDYNKPGKTLKATFTVNVFATQTPEEEDSFGKDYDAGVMQVHELTNLFTEKVGGLSSTLAAELEGVDQSFENAVQVQMDTSKEGKVAAKFTFGSQFEAENSPASPGQETNSTKALSTAFTATASKIADTLYADKDNLKTLTISGGDPVNFSEVTDEKIMRQKLSSALTSAVMKSGIQNKITLTVDVVTKAGATVSYELEFDFTNSNIISDNSIGNGYVASLVNALQSWVNDGKVSNGTSSAA